MESGGDRACGIRMDASEDIESYRLVVDDVVK